jgi:hypothetical protein
MKLIARITLIPTLLLAIAGGAFAQDTATTAERTSSENRSSSTHPRHVSTDGAAAAKSAETATTATSAEPAAEAPQTAPARGRDLQGSEETLAEFGSLLRRHPPELGTILALDPTLLSNQAFLNGYPELATFVTDHPEVRRNPRFYLSDFQPQTEKRNSSLDEMLQNLVIFATFTLVAFFLAWIIRTVIEQKRWTRLSRTQSEVHNKILDRFASSDELLQYVKTPAGTKFLESAPIPLHAEHASQRAPMTRILWSVQLGVVVFTAAIGMLFLSSHFEGDNSQGFFAMGVIGLCVGAGFIFSAVVSLILSRRLGLWQPPQQSMSEIAAPSEL